MKNWKNLYTFIVILVNTCLTFCKESYNEKFTDDYLKENFPLEDFPNLKIYYDDYGNANFTFKFNVIKKKLKCETYEKIKTIDNASKFSIHRGGYVTYDEFYLERSEYCLQPYEQENKLKLKLEFCLLNAPALTTLHYLLLILTAIFLIVPTAIYIAFKEIRETLNGKLCIALVMTQIYIIFIMPLENIENFDIRYFTAIFYFIGAFSTSFVVNLMCFDIYLTLKHFREPHYQSAFFKKFVIFLIIFFFSATIVFSIIRPFYSDIFTYMLLGAMLTFLLNLLMNIFSLISSFYYLISVTRSSNISENTRFDIEKERFLMYLQLFAIMTICWYIEIRANWMWNSHESKIIADIIKCLSAVFCSYLLLSSSLVYSLIFEKYGTMNNEDIENNTEG
ncbi:hypothetical protein PVAND_011081 [Polypedilum vanderplanki]|uniref:Methuselah N-terminal domain-containing protein n=1 Tax=Polypedilum vanderplanki TaxID=319348 RepID=A0A9J6CIW7_POLVA|nr:hypothetical protein PVAND_011081 [Polypedilum vanderplanki]